MNGGEFVAVLRRENEEMLARLAPGQALTTESRGDLSPRHRDPAARVSLDV